MRLDALLRPLPLREGDAAMIAETRAARLLGGFRGRPPGDVTALARALESLADFAVAEGDALIVPRFEGARGSAGAAGIGAG